MPVGKKITRRKPGTGPSVNYFNQDTQKAIIEFVQADKAAREKLYVEFIYPAFKTLVENLINVYGFQIRHESKEDLRNACIDFLYGIIPKFNPEKGSKAFSYFNVIAKRWLIIQSKKNTKNVQIFSSLDDHESFTSHDLEIIENYHVLPAPDEIITQEEQLKAFHELMENIQKRIKTDNELSCLKAISVLFENVDDIDLFLNKRAIMVYIREITRLTPKQLSIVLGNLKKHYKTIKQEMENL